MRKNNSNKVKINGLIMSENDPAFNFNRNLANSRVNYLQNKQEIINEFSCELNSNGIIKNNDLQLKKSKLSDSGKNSKDIDNDLLLEGEDILSILILEETNP